MAEVKALFPIGKTQWAKWSDDQRKAFNALRAQGKSFDTAVTYINSSGFGPEMDDEPELKPVPKKKKSIFDVIEDAVEEVTHVAATVGGVAAAVSPTIAVAKAVTKTVAKAKKGK